MSSLVPQSPLMLPIQWQGQTPLHDHEIQAILDSTAYVGRLGARILYTHDIDALKMLLHEVICVLGHLQKNGHEGSDLHSLIMCLQLRLSDKIGKKKKLEWQTHYSERSMYALFRKNPTRYIPGAHILPVPEGTPTSRPDFFLEVNTVFSVAEFKATGFGQRHLFQLQEYMGRFEAQHGYAVATALACELPSNVSFIKMFPGKTKTAKQAGWPLPPQATGGATS